MILVIRDILFILAHSQLTSSSILRLTLTDFPTPLLNYLDIRYGTVVDIRRPRIPAAVCFRCDTNAGCAVLCLEPDIDLMRLRRRLIPNDQVP